MAETLKLISEIAYIVAGVAFVVAVVLFILFHIPAVIGELSGRTARRNIEKIRAANEKSGAKAYRPDAKNVERGKITDAVSKDGAKTGSLMGTAAVRTGKATEEINSHAEPDSTGLLAEKTEKSEAVSGLVPSMEEMHLSSATTELDTGASLTSTLVEEEAPESTTEALADRDKGDVLPVPAQGEGSEETGELSEPDGTMALDDYSESELAAQNAPTGAMGRRRSVRGGVELTMIEEIILIHTEEVID